MTGLQTKTHNLESLQNQVFLKNLECPNYIFYRETYGKLTNFMNNIAYLTLMYALPFYKDSASSLKLNQAQIPSQLCSTHESLGLT